MQIKFVLETGERYEVYSPDGSILGGVVNRLKSHEPGLTGQFEVRSIDTGVKVDASQRWHKDAIFSLVKVS